MKRVGEKEKERERFKLLNFLINYNKQDKQQINETRNRLTNG